MINLTADQKKLLESQVAAGNFSSVEEAVSIAVSDMRMAADADLSWMKPYVEEARREAEAGNVISGEEFLADLDRIIEALPPK